MDGKRMVPDQTEGDWEPTYASARDPASWMSRLEDLDAHLITNVLKWSTPKDVASWISCNRSTRELSRDDASFWKELCMTRWSQRTSPDQWISKDGIDSYRNLYVSLHRLERVIGYWRITNDLSRGGLCRFRWTRDRILGETFEQGHLVSFVDIFVSDCVQAVDEKHLALRNRTERKEGWSSLESRAAAATATVRADGASASPEDRHFEQEMLRFMAGTVAARGTRRRRSSATNGNQPMLFFERVQFAPPDIETPYSGLWTVQRPNTRMEIVCIVHQNDKIVATKVVGDEFVPAGEIDWIAEKAWAFGGGEVETSWNRRLQAGATTRLECGHKAKSQVALPGFREPRWMDGYLVKLSDGTLLLAYETIHDRNARMHRLVTEDTDTAENFHGNL